MKAQVITFKHPFDPMARQDQLIRRPHRIRHLAPRVGVHVAVLNGKPLMRAAWRRRLAHGDQLIFQRLPAGGRGAGQSNPARTLAMMALMAFAPTIATAAFGGIGGTVLGMSAVKLGQVAVVLAGSAAINALFPAATPKQLPQPSPTYTIGAQGNMARLGGAIPVQYGRLLAYPDLAAQPYTEFAGDDQYVYQLLCLGAGSFSIEEIRIEDTPISSFAEIDYQVVRPGQQVTLFPTAVVTSEEVSGQELAGRVTANWTASGSTITFTETAHGRASGQAVRIDGTAGTIAAGVYAITGVPTADTWTITVAGASASGTAYVRSVMGGTSGFVASAAGTEAHYLGIDLVLPLGLYATAGDGSLTSLSLSVQVEAQPIDAAGAPTGSWAALGTIDITDRTNTPIRRSYRYAVTPGRYRVRMWRMDAKSTATNAGHQVIWSGLRSYMADAQDWPDVTLIAMRMRATNNLSVQSSRRVAVLATRELPIWNGTTWSAPTATRSIAWAIADAARSTSYGPGMADREIDLGALLALDATWAARGDYFDGRFDQKATWWEAIQAVARTGRAQCFLQGGILRVVRDGPATVPVALFSERNILKGSFAIDYVNPTVDTADAIKAKFFDAATWSERTITCALPDSTATKPASAVLFGITGADHATREGTFLAAVNKRRRRIVRFGTEQAGRRPLLGELIAVQHSMPGWGQQAEALDWAPGPRRLTVSEPMIWTPGETHRALLRRPDGSAFGPVEVTQGADVSEMILASAPDFDPLTGNDAVRTHVTFGYDDTYAALAKVRMVTARNLYEYEVQAVVEDPSVHLADSGLTTPAPVYSQLPGTITRPVVSGLVARRLPGSATKVLFSWNQAPNATAYLLDMAEGADPLAANVSWTRVVDTTGNSAATDILYAARTMIRLRAVGLAVGPAVYALVGDLLPDFWLDDSTPFWLADATPFWSS